MSSSSSPTTLLSLPNESIDLIARFVIDSNYSGHTDVRYLCQANKRLYSICLPILYEEVYWDHSLPCWRRERTLMRDGGFLKHSPLIQRLKVDVECAKPKETDAGILLHCEELRSQSLWLATALTACCNLRELVIISGGSWYAHFLEDDQRIDLVHAESSRWWEQALSPVTKEDSTLETLSLLGCAIDFSSISPLYNLQHLEFYETHHACFYDTYDTACSYDRRNTCSYDSGRVCFHDSKLSCYLFPKLKELNCQMGGWDGDFEEILSSFCIGMSPQLRNLAATYDIPLADFCTIFLRGAELVQAAFCISFKEEGDNKGGAAAALSEAEVATSSPSTPIEKLVLEVVRNKFRSPFVAAEEDDLNQTLESLKILKAVLMLNGRPLEYLSLVLSPWDRRMFAASRRLAATLIDATKILFEGVASQMDLHFTASQ